MCPGLHLQNSGLLSGRGGKLQQGQGKVQSCPTMSPGGTSESLDVWQARSLYLRLHPRPSNQQDQACVSVGCLRSAPCGHLSRTVPLNDRVLQGPGVQAPGSGARRAWVCPAARAHLQLWQAGGRCGAAAAAGLSDAGGGRRGGGACWL